MNDSTQSLPIALAVSLAACVGGTAGRAGPTAPTAPQPPPATADAAEAAPPDETAPTKVSTNLYIEVPLLSTRFNSTPVVAVDDEVITVRDLVGGLARPAGKEDGATAPATPGDETYASVLERLVDTRLMLVEARAMGLEEDPRVTTALAEFEEDLLRTMVRERALELVEPDPAEVDEIFEANARRWKIRSALLEKEVDAAALHAEVSRGGDFDPIVDRWIADGRARGAEAAEEMTLEGMLPPIRAAVEQLAAGAIAPVLPVPNGYAVLRLEEITHPEDPAKRAEAEALSLGKQRAEALRKHYESLITRYARIQEKRLARLDFEARRPGFAALAKSSKILVEIDGEAPVTIADLAAALRKDFFHGVESAVRDRKINEKKRLALDKILARRLLLKQAIDDRLRETDEFRDRVRDKRIELVVGHFVSTVVVPAVQLTEDDVKAHYDSNLEEFSLPELVRLESMGFTSAAAAADAAQALREETDWSWLLANADELAAEDARTIPNSDRLLTTAGLPEPLADAFGSAKIGTLALYEGPAGIHYVVRLAARVPAKPRPFVEIRQELAQRLFRERVEQAVGDWTARLRKVYTVRRYIKSLETTRVPAAPDTATPPTGSGDIETTSVAPQPPREAP